MPIESQEFKLSPIPRKKEGENSYTRATHGDLRGPRRHDMEQKNRAPFKKGERVTLYRIKRDGGAEEESTQIIKDVYFGPNRHQWFITVTLPKSSFLPSVVLTWYPDEYQASFAAGDGYTYWIKE